MLIYKVKVNTLKKKQEVTGITPEEVGVLAQYSLEIREINPREIQEGLDVKDLGGSSLFS